MSSTIHKSLALSGALAVVALLPSAAVNAQDTASLFAKIKSSLAIVLNSDGVGTAFCVSSTPDASYYLTNAHVVGSDNSVTVFRQFPTFSQMKGTVVARGLQMDPDLAVIKVGKGNIPPLALGLSDLREGDPIANAGYPSAQYTLAQLTGTITPAVHVGTISAIENRGGIIEYDAQTLPGNSGGPLFDPRTGAVVGIVEAKLKQTTDANLGIGISRIVIPFLNQNRIAYLKSSVSNPEGSGPSESAAQTDLGILRTLPGAGVVVVLYDTSHSTGENTSNFISEAASDFATKFSQSNHVRAITLDAQFTNPDGIAKLARDNGAIMALTYGTSFHALSSFSIAYGSSTKRQFSLQSGLVDMYGNVWLNSGKFEKIVTSARDVQSAIVSSLADLDDQAVASLHAKLFAQGDDSATNLFRYALPIPNGGKRAFFGLSPMSGGAKATVFSFSVAADSGLQSGDLVLSVNGVVTSGKTASELNAMLQADSASGPYDLVIESADGKQQHIKFESKDLRWYVEHRQQEDDVGSGQ